MFCLLKSISAMNPAPYQNLITWWKYFYTQVCCVFSRVTRHKPKSFPFFGQKFSKKSNQRDVQFKENLEYQVVSLTWFQVNPTKDVRGCKSLDLNFNDAPLTATLNLPVKNNRIWNLSQSTPNLQRVNLWIRRSSCQNFINFQWKLWKWQPFYWFFWI